MNQGIKHQILWLIFKQQWINIILEFVAFLGSIVTICGAYFKDGFKIENRSHWFIAALVILIFFLFIIKCYRILFNWKSLNFPKKTFFPYISTQAHMATNIIRSIAGDLSWLKHQKETYEEIIQKIPVEIYYSDDNVKGNDETIALINEYKKLGVKMIPYPFNVETKYIKGLLVDSDENAKFFSFFKEQDDSISCSKYTKNTNEYYLAKSFIDSIDNYINLKKNYISAKQDLENLNKFMQLNKTVFIGVSGLNNIGKSTLCKELKLKYGESLIVIEDSFIGEVKLSSFEVALFCLLNQILEFNRLRKENPSKVIYIFDRTPIDNFTFLMLYKSGLHNQYDRYIERLEQEIKLFMMSFDIIALLTQEGKNRRYKSTTNLDVSIRTKVTDKLKYLYHKIYSEKVVEYKIIKYKKEEDFKKRICEIVEDIAGRISKE